MRFRGGVLASPCHGSKAKGADFYVGSAKLIITHRFPLILSAGWQIVQIRDFDPVFLMTSQKGNGMPNKYNYSDTE
jgi:hypothetical protein